MLKTEGLLIFYKGLSSALIGVVLSFGVYFWWYRFFKNFYYTVLGRSSLSDFDISVITMLSGVINALLTNPIWLVNARMSVSSDKKTLIETIKKIYREEGIFAFYKGVMPNMILIINPIINFVIYENLKKGMLKSGYSLNTFQLTLINSIAKLIATIATYPILTVRIRLQATNEQSSA